MYRHIDWQGDQHLACKQINQVFVDKLECDAGRCPHRPVFTSVKVTGDMSYKNNTLICVYCGQELEEVKTYRLKDTLPIAPRSA